MTKPQNPTGNAREDGVRMRQFAFLAAYGKSGRISAAAAMAEIDRGTHYDWLKDQAYRDAFMVAGVLAFQNLEDEAIRRAMGADGASPSDRLMIKLLESLGPTVGRKEYAPNVKHEHGGAGGGPIDLNVSASEILLSRIAGLVTGDPTPKGD
jgi:hypothetical protein